MSLTVSYHESCSVPYRARAGLCEQYFLGGRSQRADVRHLVANESIS